MSSTTPSDRRDATTGDDRYVADETYEGELVITDRENHDAWIRSDVVRSLER